MLVAGRRHECFHGRRHGIEVEYSRDRIKKDTLAVATVSMDEDQRVLARVGS